VAEDNLLDSPALSPRYLAALHSYPPPRRLRSYPTLKKLPYKRRPLLARRRRRAYLVRLYAKELVMHNFVGLPADQLLERMVELSLRTEEHL
jgi:hypothetical protein